MPLASISSCCWQQRSSAINQNAADSMLWRLAGTKTWFLGKAALTPPTAIRDFMTRLHFDRDLSGFVADHHVVLEKCCGILRNRLELFAERRERRAVHRMRMAHRHDVLMHFMHRCMQHKTGSH